MCRESGRWVGMSVLYPGGYPHHSSPVTMSLKPVPASTRQVTPALSISSRHPRSLYDP